jgi:hypothetical protein
MQEDLKTKIKDFVYEHLCNVWLNVDLSPKNASFRK